MTSSYAAIRALGALSQAGWTGVVLFFALSGYLITRSLVAALSANPPRPQLLRHFYRRRALRILPLYTLALAAATGATLLCRCAPTVLPTLAVYALFLQNIAPFAAQTVLHPAPLPLYHLWSLAVEEQFYLLWPVALLLLYRSSQVPASNPIASTGRPAGTRALTFTLLAAAATILFRILLWTLPHGTATLFDTFLLTQATPILLGAALAVAPLQHSNRQFVVARRAAPAFLCGLSLYLITSHIAGTLNLVGRLQYTLGLPAISLAAVALLPLTQAPGHVRRLFSMHPLPWLGRISYGFYVFHILLQPLFDRIARQLTNATAGFPYQIARLAVALPITIAVAWLSFHFFETPFLRMQPGSAVQTGSSRNDPGPALH